MNDESHHFSQKVKELKENLLDTSDNLSVLMSEIEFKEDEEEEKKKQDKWKDEVFLNEKFLLHGNSF